MWPTRIYGSVRSSWYTERVGCRPSIPGRDNHETRLVSASAPSLRPTLSPIECVPRDSYPGKLNIRLRLQPSWKICGDLSPLLHTSSLNTDTTITGLAYLSAIILELFMVRGKVAKILEKKNTYRMQHSCKTHTATPVNNLSITRFGLSLSRSAQRQLPSFRKENIDSDTSGVYCLHIA